jgi:hypothetical protein
MPRFRHPPFDPEAARRIVAAVGSGAFPWAAAEAAGVSRGAFAAWLRRKGEPYRTFRRQVAEAEGRARVLAEVQAYQKDVKFWLRYGPGRTRPGRAGWSDLRKHRPGREVAARRLLRSRAWGRIQQALLTALQAWPEARARVAAALAELAERA